MPLVKVEEQVFSLLIFSADGGPPVASRWWADGGQPMVGRHRQATGMCHRLAIGSPTVDCWWQFAAYSHWRIDGVVLSGILPPARHTYLLHGIDALLHGTNFLFRAATFCAVQLFSVPCSCFLFHAAVFCSAAGL